MNILKKIIIESKHDGIRQIAKLAVEDELDIFRVNHLAWYFYLIDDKETAFQLIALIKDDSNAICREFDKCLALSSVMYKERGMLEESEKCIHQIVDRLDKITKSAPNIKILVHNLLNGKLLDYARLTNSEDVFNEYDVYDEYDERLAHLKRLVWIHELGGGEEFSVERANKEIEENIAILKALIKNGHPRME